MSGFESYRQDGSVIVSSDRAGTMVYIETLTLNPGQSGSKSFPKIAPDGLICQPIARSSHTLSIGTDGNGSPQLSWTAGSWNQFTSPTLVVVMAKKLIDSVHGAGFDLRTPSGNVVACSDYPVPQCVGFADFKAESESTTAVAEGYNLYIHRTVSEVTAGQSARRYLVLGLPDSGTTDIWYAMDVSIASPGTLYPSLFVFSKTNTYTLPRLFIFAIDNPNPLSSLQGLQVQDPTGKLLYDALAENMAITDVTGVNYLPYGQGTTTYSLTTGFATYTGIIFPGASWVNYDSSGFMSGGYGAVRKSGGQLTFRLMQSYNTKPGSDDPVRYSDPITNLFCGLVDLTYLGYKLSDGHGGNSGGGSTGTAPQITRHPGNITVNSGNVAIFSVAANGSTPLLYQWYKNGNPVSGATSASYSSLVSESDTGSTYFCIVTNGYGSVQSNAGRLTVLSGSTVTPVAFTSHPQSQSVVAGNSVTFSVTVSGTTPISLQWYRNNSPISGATGSSYNFSVTEANNGNTFYCVASNSQNTTTSATATLTVTPAPFTAPVIDVQPSNITANQGQEVYMYCSAYPVTRYAWYKDGVYYADGQRLRVPTSTLGSSSWYCLVYNNSATTTSSSATLSVIGPSTSPYSSYVNFNTRISMVDNPVNFHVYANGSTENGRWANGTGDGSYYTVSATGDFTPTAASNSFGVEYDLGTNTSVLWQLPRINSSTSGVTRTGILNVTIRLKGGGVVATGRIELTTRTPGTVET